MNKNQLTGFYIIVGIIGFLFIMAALNGPVNKVDDISYTKFLKKVELNQIESVQIDKDILIAVPVGAKSDETPVGALAAKTSDVKNYKVTIPQNSERLYQTLEDHNVEVDLKPAETQSLVATLSSFIAPIFFIVLLILIFKGIQQGGSQALSFVKSKAKLMIDKINVTAMSSRTASKGGPRRYAAFFCPNVGYRRGDHHPARGWRCAWHRCPW